MAAVVRAGDAVGTSNCHVRLSKETIDSPLVSAPNMLVAMNEPSLRKFDKSVRAGGWVIYNGEEFPADCWREGVHVLALPFTELADELGDKRAANMVMLGAVLEIAGVLPEASVARLCTAWSRIRAGWNWMSARSRGAGNCSRNRSAEAAV